MPGQQPPIPNFSVGEILTARKLTQLGDGVRANNERLGFRQNQVVAPATQSPIRVTVVAEHPEYMECRIPGEDDTVSVLKHHQHRVSPFDGQTIQDISYVYDGDLRRTATAVSGDFNGLSETHELQRPLFVVMAPRPADGTLDGAGDEIVWEDINEAGTDRYWRRRVG